MRHAPSRFSPSSPDGRAGVGSPCCWWARSCWRRARPPLQAPPAVVRATSRRPAADPAVIPAWNEIAVATITGPAPNGAGKANAEAFLWFGFVQAAVYNAVNGITRRYELYEWNARGPRAASPQAAAAAAAHRVLLDVLRRRPRRDRRRTWMPRWRRSLAQIPDGVAEEPGRPLRRAGGRPAHRLRADDGRFAPIVFDVPPAPGVWRPTPPANAPFFDPWLGQVDPLVLDSPTQFRPGPPPAISSDLYVEEFEEVRDYGVKTSSLRDAAADGDGAVLLRHRRRAAPGGAARPRDPARAGHQRQRPPVRRGRPEPRRRGRAPSGTASSTTAGGVRSRRSARPTTDGNPDDRRRARTGSRWSSRRPTPTGRAA